MNFEIFVFFSYLNKINFLKITSYHKYYITKYYFRNSVTFYKIYFASNLILCNLQNDVVKLADFGSCRSVYSKQPYTEYISTRW